MEEIWGRIDSWLDSNAPLILKDLSPGASEDKIAEVESTLGIKMTDTLRQSFIIHDGQLGDRYPLLGDWNLLSLDDALEEWEVMRELYQSGSLEGEVEAAEGVQPSWWNLKWLPIAGNGSGDFYCADFDPTELGTIGQIVEFLHVDTTRAKVADSLYDLLSNYAMSLENGLYKLRNNTLMKIG